VLDPSLRAPLTLARDDGRVLLTSSKAKAGSQLAASLHDCRAYTPHRWPFERCRYLTAHHPGDALDSLPAPAMRMAVERLDVWTLMQ
jgi:hypothetical protein